MCILETASLYAICSTNQRELLDYRTKRVTWNDNNTTTLSPRHVLSLYHVHFPLNCRKPNFARTSVRRRLSPMLRKHFVSALAGARCVEGVATITPVNDRYGISNGARTRDAILFSNENQSLRVNVCIDRVPGFLFAFTRAHSFLH